MAKARTNKTYRTSKKWKPPRVGSKARAKIPKHAFLLPATRRFPFKSKDPKTGRYIADTTGLMAAYRRAILQGNRVVARKALSKLNPIRVKQGKKKLPL